MIGTFNQFFMACLIILAVLCFFCLVRAIKGPKMADRIMATNMIGTLIIAMIALMAVWLNESSVLDICLIFAIMSFVAVIVLVKIYIGLYNQRKYEQEQHGKGDETT